MFSDFQDYHPKVTVGYEDFRRRVNNKNIWFAAHNTLTYETCMRFELLITTWRVRYTDCNENIRRGLVLVGPIMMRTKRKTRPKNSDLQKVIMLHGMEGVKTRVFTNCLVIFHETYLFLWRINIRRHFPNKQGRYFGMKPKPLLVALPLMWHLCL